MTDETLPPEPPVGEKLVARMRWERERALGRRSDNERPIDFAAIVFPDYEGMRRAALRVCADAKDAEDAKVLLDALGIIDIMLNGGDGRKLKVQRGPVFREEDTPARYTDADDAKPKKRKPRA